MAGRTNKSKSPPLTGSTCFSPSVLQIVILSRGVLLMFNYHYDNFFFVSYPIDYCVKVFNNAGVYLYDIGCEGSGDGQLRFPIGLVVDKFNQLIVCDKLQLFTLDDFSLNFPLRSKYNISKLSLSCR